MTDDDEPVDDLAFDPYVLVGAWANTTGVQRGRDELTIDFIRHVPDRARPVLVARAIVSYVVAVELRDQLDDAWRGYHEWSMPEDPPMDELPLPRSGVLKKGVLYRVPSPRRKPRPELTPEIRETIERGRRKRIQEYLDSRRRRAS